MTTIVSSHSDTVPPPEDRRASEKEFDQRIQEDFFESRGVLDEDFQAHVKSFQARLKLLRSSDGSRCQSEPNCDLTEREKGLIALSEELIVTVLRSGIATEQRMGDSYQCETIMRKAIAEQSQKLSVQDELICLNSELQGKVATLQGKFRAVVDLLEEVKPLHLPTMNRADRHIFSTCRIPSSLSDLHDDPWAEDDYSGVSCYSRLPFDDDFKNTRMKHNDDYPYDSTSSYEAENNAMQMHRYHHRMKTNYGRRYSIRDS